MTTDLRRHAPATTRNREPIADVLARLLPEPATVLEIASGTGEHAAYFAARFPHLTWQPSDFDTESLPSIDAWAADGGVANVRKALQLDASADTWPVEQADAIFSANMIHIAPIAACEGLLRGAGAPPATADQAHADRVGSGGVGVGQDVQAGERRGRGHGAGRLFHEGPTVRARVTHGWDPRADGGSGWVQVDR